MGPGETVWDIAELCDVSPFVLSDYNPSLGKNSNHVFEGQTLNIPHANSINQSEFFRTSISDVPRDSIASLPLSPILKTPRIYHVESGDTLSGIASRHNISAAQIANLNPGIDWRYIPVGMAIKLPAERIANAPVVSSGDKPRVNTAQILQVSREAVRPGGTIRLAAYGLPAQKAVSIYRGPNRREMTYVGEFFTTDEGKLYADARINKSADPGGVIFAAAIDGEYLYSRRVNVVKVRNTMAR